MTELKPCPFCSHQQVYHYKDFDGGHHVHCPNCKARGPTINSKDEAIKAWDETATPDRTLAKELVRLLAWKAEVVAVEREWDAQAVAKLLGVPLSQSCRAGIAAKVTELLAERDKLIGWIDWLEDEIETDRLLNSEMKKLSEIRHYLYVREMEDKK